MNEYILRIAEKEDLPVVARLYSEAAGRTGCTWNEYYPTKEDAENDLAHGCLYVYENRKEVIGAISVVPENEHDSNCEKPHYARFLSGPFHACRGRRFLSD